MEIKNKDIEQIIQRTKQEIKKEEQINNQFNTDRGGSNHVFNAATEESQEAQIPPGSQQQQFDQTYDYAKIEIDAEDLDHRIENNTISNNKVVSELNSEMQSTVNQFNQSAAAIQQQKENGKLRVVSKDLKHVNHPSSNSAS